MSADQVRRGRPKGSGLDDQAYLDEIRRKLEGNPALRPTTAIKLLGISDPATIRRLRDKLRSVRPEPAPQIAATAATSDRDTSLPGSAHADGTHVMLPDAAGNDAIEWLAQWCGLGLHALSTTVDAQMAAIETILRVPQVASVLRQQLLLNQHMISLCASSPDVRKTLH